MRPRLRLLAAAAVVALGCRQVLGIETRTEGDAPLELGDACGSCVVAQCEPAERACAADPACAKAAECMALAGVDNPLGRKACTLEHVAGATTAAFETLDACMRAPCQGPCYGRGGLYEAYSTDCQACMATSCGDAMGACVADARCEELAVDAFGDPTRIAPPEVHRFRKSPGVEGIEERLLDECLNGCLQACGLDGRNLDCVSAYAWPTKVAETALLEMVVSVLLNAAGATDPLPGALVEFCAPLTDGCAAVASAVTDASGLAGATLAMPSLIGFRGYLRITGTLQGMPTYPVHFQVYPLLEGARGSTSTFPTPILETAGQLIAGGILPGRAHLDIVLPDCSLRRAPGLVIELPPGALEGATVYYSGGDATSDDGEVVVFNAMPGCYDVVVRTVEGVETHRMRIHAAPDVATVAYLFPKADPPDVGRVCTPDYTF